MATTHRRCLPSTRKRCRSPPGAPVEVTGTLQPAFDTNQAAVFTGSNMENLAAFTPFNGKPYVQATFVGPASANLPGGQNGS
jgi:hypothetical protein